MTSADFSKALTLEISPSKVLHLSPRAARLYLVRLDGVRVSLFLASSPPAPGLDAGSCSCGRGFAFRFLQLHLAATPCGSANPHFSPGGAMIAQDFRPQRVLATESVAGTTFEGVCAR